MTRWVMRIVDIRNKKAERALCLFLSFSFSPEGLEETIEKQHDSPECLWQELIEIRFYAPRSSQSDVYTQNIAFRSRITPRMYTESYFSTFNSCVIAYIKIDLKIVQIIMYTHLYFFQIYYFNKLKYIS